MQSPATNNHVYIDLDDPPQWWMPILSAVLVLLMVAVIVAPWFVDLDDDEATNTPLPGTSSLCRPNTQDLPAVFNPSVSTWTRLCEWFIAPETENGN